MAAFDLREYARRGAQVRVSELEQELETIYSAFPDLRRRPRGRPSSARQSAAASSSAAAAAPRTRKRSGMSAAQRRAVSLRMKRYWAERRKTKGAK